MILIFYTAPSGSMKKKKQFAVPNGGIVSAFLCICDLVVYAISNSLEKTVPFAATANRIETFRSLDYFSNPGS